MSSGWAALFESASASKKRSLVAHAGRCLNTACTMPEAVSTLLTMYTDCRPYYESSAERETERTVLSLPYFLSLQGTVPVSAAACDEFPKF